MTTNYKLVPRRKPIKQPAPSNKKKKSLATGTASNSKAVKVEDRKLLLKYFLDGLDFEAMEQATGYNIPYIERELAKAMASLSDYYTKPTNVENFLRYAAFQMRLITQLQELYDTFLERHKKMKEKKPGHASEIKGGTALVSAIKAQSDIYDKIYAKGKECGVMATAAENRDEESALSRKTPEQLRLILKEQATTVITLLEMAEEDVAEAGLLQQARMQRLAKQSEQEKIWREPKMKDGRIVYATYDWKRMGKTNKKQHEARVVRNIRVEYHRLQEIKSQTSTTTI